MTVILYLHHVQQILGFLGMGKRTNELSNCYYEKLLSDSSSKGKKQSGGVAMSVSEIVDSLMDFLCCRDGGKGRGKGKEKVKGEKNFPYHHHQPCKKVVEFVVSITFRRFHHEAKEISDISSKGTCCSLVILLGGTSGSGKSTLSSLLASRLGVANFSVISTDHIRHVIRSRWEKTGHPDRHLITCSSYQVVDQILKDNYIENVTFNHGNGEASFEISDNKVVALMKGLDIQSHFVQQELQKILLSLAGRGKCVIIEGVHLTCKYMLQLAQSGVAEGKRLFHCIPMVVHIGNRKKHLERFAIRSKYMTIDARDRERYFENFERIRQIQDCLVSEAQQYKIPILNNTNLDRSICIVHKSILCYLQEALLQDSPLHGNNLNILHRNFSLILQQGWSSKSALKQIRTSKKINSVSWTNSSENLAFANSNLKDKKFNFIHFDSNSNDEASLVGS